MSKEQNIPQGLPSETKTKRGYKKTKLGWIPEEWEIKKLGDLGSFSKGKGISKKELTKTGFPCIRYGEIYTSHDFFIKNFYSFIDNKTAKQSKTIKKNDILFAGSGETLEDIGKSVAYLGEDEAYVGGDIIILSAKGVDVLFLVYLLNSNCIIKQRIRLGQGHSVVHIYANYLKELLIPYPSFPEQQKIAQILSTWDRAIEKYELLIMKYELRKKGLMQQLLSGKRRFRKFKRSKWRKVKIGNFGKVITGNTPSKAKQEYWGGNFSWATAHDLKNKYVINTTEKITEKGKSVSRMLPKGSVLVTCIASIGLNAIAGENLATNQQINSIIVDE